MHPRSQPTVFIFPRVVIAVACSVSSFAQTWPVSAEPLDWWDNIDGFLNAQHGHSLSTVSSALEAFPPTLKEPLERRMALLMLDNVLHEQDAAKRPTVQSFFHSRIRTALKEIKGARVSDGARIWKLYNHGFIIRTSSVTFAFDLVRAHSARADGFALSDDLMRDLVAECEALFISHRHGDHADEFVAEEFIRSGKPVVAPPEVWANKPIHDKLTHLDRDADLVQLLPIDGGAKTLRVINFPGHQGERIQNNVPLVITPEDLSFAQTGNQSNDDDFSWIDLVGHEHKVDVLFPNCWTPNITRMIKGFDPSLVITGHENEMGHTIDHREPHWLTYVRLGVTATPYIVMTWGESYHYVSM